MGRVESLAQQAAETTLNKYVLTELGRIAFGFEPSKAGRLTYGTVLLTYDFVDDPNEGLRLFVPRKARYSHHHLRARCQLPEVWPNPKILHWLH